MAYMIIQETHALISTRMNLQVNLFFTSTVLTKNFYYWKMYAFVSNDNDKVSGSAPPYQQFITQITDRPEFRFRYRKSIFSRYRVRWTLLPCSYQSVGVIRTMSRFFFHTSSRCYQLGFSFTVRNTNVSFTARLKSNFKFLHVVGLVGDLKTFSLKLFVTFLRLSLK